MAKEKETKHWRDVYPTDYLGSHDLVGGKQPILTFSKFERKDVVAPGGLKNECIVMHFAEKDYRPMVINKTNAKTIELIYKTANPNEWVGKQVQIYVDPNARQFGGGTGNALRIKPMKPKAVPKDAAAKELSEWNAKVREALSHYKGDDKADYKSDLNDHRKAGTLTVELLKQICKDLIQATNNG